MNIELIEQAANEIAEYNPVEAGLVELRNRLENVSYDVTTVKGMAIAKADRAEVRTLRTSLEAKRKEIKAPALAHCKLIDEEAKRITTELLKLEVPIDEQIKARELVMEAERAAREAAEKARVMAITERIAGIRQYIELAASCRTSERIQLLQDKLAELAVEGFEEFQEEAELAHKQAGAKVEELLTAKLEQEAEQARIKAEQAEAVAKLANERAVFEAQQSAAKIEADRLASERLAQIAAEVQAQALKRKAEQAELDIQRAAAEADRLDLERRRQEFEDQVFEAKTRAALAEAAENKAMLDQQAADAAMIATHEEEVRQATTKEEVPEFPDPSDAEMMWEAIKACSDAFDMTTPQVTARLAAVQWEI